MQLKYLFIAGYKDGTYYTQNQEDMSEKDPKRSCFYDINQEELSRFVLYDDINTFVVDLIDGHFEVNGIPFFMHDIELKDFRLIYFRRHRHHFNLDNEELAHEVSFRLGWQANDKDDKNHQRVMEIN